MFNEHWYAAIASSQLGEKPVATRVGTEAIVLFRTSDGATHAIADRCCHRGIALSKGRLENNLLVCAFHGWKFDASGVCVDIPSQPAGKIPASFAVKSYRCVEADGYVWLWMGTTSPQTKPSLQGFREGKWFQGSRILECDFVKALEINLDTAHLYYVHPSHPATINAASAGFALQEHEIRTSSKGFRIFHPPTDNPAAPIGATTFLQEFSLPGNIMFERGPFRFHFMIVPLDVDRCRMEFLFSNMTPMAQERITWIGTGAGMLDEDQDILEALPKSTDRSGMREVSVESDVPALILRKLLKLAEHPDDDALKMSIPARRIFSVMGARGYYAHQENPSNQEKRVHVTANAG
jgi:phenylpropionate dioxygenase-like ring-hydroxylating dioxygenase large terminal subunit